MKKQDLRKGYCVILRNGSKCLVTTIEGVYYFIRIDGTSLTFYNYKDDLKNDYCNEFDVVKVYKDFTCLKLLWGRKEKSKLTEDEKAILRNLPEGFEWIARDEDGELWIYKNKPDKTSSQYNCKEGSIELYLFQNIFQSIKWEDGAPYCINDLLQEGSNG